MSKLFLIAILLSFAAQSEESEEPQDPEYVVTVITWYGEHVPKKIQELDKPFKKQQACERRVSYHKNLLASDDPDFAKIILCVERKK